MKKVYIELVLLDNFLMDFVILFFAVRLSEKRVQFSRISLGAGIGAVYSAFALGFPLLSGLFIKCMALGLMCLPLGARPFKRYLLRCGLALLCSFLFGGCIFFAMLALGAPLEGAYLGLPILRYVLLGVLVFTAPIAFAMGASQSTSSIFKSWCRMFGGQLFLLLMNAWCLRLFISMVGAFIANPLSI